MKKLLLRTLKLFLALFFPGLLFAQPNPDYTMLLNAGKFIPQENIQTLKPDAEVFRHSTFNGKSYVVVQFKTLPDQQQKVQLTAAGITLLDYLPNLAYTASLPQHFNPAQFKNLNVRSVFRLSAAQKTVPAVLKNNLPVHAIKQPGYADLSVITFEKLSTVTLQKEFSKLQITVLEEMPMFRTFTLRVPQKNLQKLLNLPFVQWAEPIDAPNKIENLLGRTLHRVNVLNDGIRNLKGDSIKIGIWDGGEVSPHVDFSPTASRLVMMETNQPESHSTHVAGTIGGRGIINPKARGMAPNAKLYSYNFNGNIQSEMFAAIPAQNLNISSHSYGSTQTCGVTGAGVAYSTTSRSTDVNLNTFPWHLHVHSAGNSQSACSGGWSTITGSGKTAKNNILVANITTTETINNSSSYGPVHDGRVKPEISAFGTNVLSTYTPLNTYGTITGTSMSTPGVSGSVALLVERYKQLNSNALPISSLIKAVVCNTAQDLGNPGPDYKFGFGRINALAAVKALEQNRYAVNIVATGATNDISITVPSGTVKLKVMLTWNDPAGAANASTALVNNLDLKVINGPTTTLPWILDKLSPTSNATRALDNISNIEQVTLDNPTAGTYTLRVNGTAVPTGPNQQYSLTWEIIQPNIEVIFPNGGESLSPGAQETITWNNAGVTGNQTIQYSINNGATWTTISAAVSATATRYSWTIPAGLNTATALIKISSGTLTDQSDVTFKILGTPASLSANPGLCAGSLNFSWPAVTNATHYDLLKLDAATGTWVNLAANVTGTSYAASGLTPGASLWFTLVAKNNLTGSQSERTLAITRSISSGGSLSLGAISGPTSLCQGSQNIPYTVPTTTGITTYTWSVPTGITIVSGQGTNNIVVNYPATSVSGNIAVYGTSGPCQTTIRNLAVSAGALAPPISTGDRMVCDFNPTPVLTATASVPAGYSVVWYNAPTGGTVVNDPSLNSPGTVTYYAATYSSSGNCESPTRTPVTLTINPVPPATINATQTAICNDGEATLTASAGNSYYWSTGETTQAIKVKQPGDYSVNITQATGCVSTSAPVTITPMPNPEVRLTAAPYKQLYPGLTTTLSATTQAAGTLSYTWKKNGMVLTGKTAATLPVSVDELGEYEVAIATSEGCTGTSNKLAISDSATSNVFIYPNPNKGRFQVRFHNQTGTGHVYSLAVYDAKGSVVLNQEFTTKEAYDKTGFNLSQYGPGIYWLQLRDLNGTKLGSGRIVVQ
ncbi:S8 family serine peptidase [Adhaeribacter sp. BT258]|uniref:S8 family serine peptidase n=1 Tax=Adhaeribacter terrigena TaxID=2793070 RepID=A0ABS1BY77_9BACT|nr:S8 family serine peptidase [Adhaeribacter terrigena]MBK0402115.1 S8 family serine peptidase [Adhaeribacter terrigena]